MANTASKHKDEERSAGAGQMASDLKNKAKEAGSAVAERAKDAASNVMEQARDAASSVSRTASNVASTVSDKAEDAKGSVASGMKSLAGTIRDRGPQEGMMGNATSSVANALESGSKYLQEHGLGDMSEDLTHLIRRNPIPAVLVGIGVGYLIARATRR